VNALLEQAAQLADRPGTLPQIQIAMLAQGRPLNDSVLAALALDAATVLEWLLGRLDNDPALADCGLRSRAQALSLITPVESETQQIRSLGRAGSELDQLVAGVVGDSICAAFDPPCALCDDTDVLLACLEVCDCTVVRVCNAKRDYVISGSALRYWLPTGSLHEWLESFCCPPARGRDVTQAETGRLAFAEAGFGIGEPVTPTPWDLLELRDPAHILRDIMERAGAAWAASAVRQPLPAAAGADVSATADQVTALSEQVAELAERLIQSQARLDETQADLRTTQDELSALGRQPQAQASPGRTSTRRRSSAAQPPADGGKPTEAPGNGAQQADAASDAAEAPTPAEATASPADAGEADAPSDAPEAGDDT
jgi:hypothetical protein